MLQSVRPPDTPTYLMEKEFELNIFPRGENRALATKIIMKVEAINSGKLHQVKLLLGKYKNYSICLIY